MGGWSWEAAQQNAGIATTPTTAPANNDGWSNFAPAPQQQQQQAGGGGPLGGLIKGISGIGDWINAHTKVGRFNPGVG